MAVHIRCARHGTKGDAFFRIVVADQRSPRDGRFIEMIGTFDPAAEGILKIDRARLEYWQQKGAIASHTLSRLLKKYPAAPAEAATG